MWTLLDREHCGLKLEPKRGLKMGLLAQVGCPRGLIILRCKLQLGTHRTCHLMPGWFLSIRSRPRAEKLVLHISLVSSSHVRRHAGT